MARAQRMAQAACTCALACNTAWAQQADAYPAKPVRVIVGLAPGGGTDIIARLLSQKLSDNLKRPFVVENRTGAGGTLAYALVAKSAADGYTLLAVASGYAITPAVYPKLSYDPVKDFTPISVVVQAPILLMVHPALPARSVKDLLALARRPGAHLDAASAGHGTSNHLALELFNSLAGVKIAHVPYKGTGQALVDLMAGQVQMMFGNILSSLQYVKIGKIRALAVTSAKRSSILPELPTVMESGVAGYETTTWHGWLGPAGLHPEIVTRLNTELARAVRSHEVMDKLIDDGGEPLAGSPDHFRGHLAAEIARWRKVVRDAGIRVE
ncbi:MAG TPA: tripartite tricarboxylate transporter substrate binding protein [Burkholderiales bacterium]|nr:tripartite tricarboxylate transporter substrate binding protein [Burkholderiales bacterium]